MFQLMRDAVHAIWSAFTRPSDLMLENIALKHQLNVVLRTSRARPRLSAIDRILWVWLSRTWSGWKESIRIVRPDTVIAWHRRGWRLYWTWRSKRRGPGRPLAAQDARDLIRKMSAENVTRGAPRIHGELLKLGIEISQATVAKFMVRHEKPPSQNWRTFLDNHVRYFPALTMHSKRLLGAAGTRRAFDTTAWGRCFRRGSECEQESGRRRERAEAPAGQGVGVHNIRERIENT